MVCKYVLNDMPPSRDHAIRIPYAAARISTLAVFLFAVPVIPSLDQFLVNVSHIRISVYTALRRCGLSTFSPYAAFLG
ncbi:hypothetical protein CPB83DRAFT_862397 [Crepidotus variabilis]|uniref:Uncharacterized protein n=1 Tax=Crepidotus variabilis TaxID=179855 RepID=A0A9P6JJZ0_9AGAR|nr:hypothetical protein CPB83DRAFT_862397 [Crepidotus variabilis]